MYVLSACGGFLFPRKSVARGALPLFCQNTPFPQKKNKCPAGKASIGLSLEMIAYMLLEYNGPWKRSLFREPYISLYVC
jgi:hypothetical protein